MNESPDRDKHHILDTLHRHHLLPAGGSWKLEPADGGLNSQVWFVRPAGGAPLLTVRRSLPDHNWVLEREAATLRELARSCRCTQDVLGLLYDERGGSGVMLVLSHAAGTPLDLAAVTNTQAEALAACLASIHAHEFDHFTIWPELEPVRDVRARAFRDRLRAIERYAAFAGTGNEQLHRQIRRSFAQLHDTPLNGEGWDEPRFALLHGDLSRGNIIWDEDRVTLIDWEYHRAGDPAEELAYLLAEQDLSDARAQLILASYVDHGGDASAVSRVPAYSALVSLDSVLWWADRFIDMGEDPGASDEVAYHLSRVQAAMRRR